MSRRPLVDLNQSAVSRYLQLATLFRRRVEIGEWAVGARIPTVDELAGEFGVARLTIRQALGQLEHDGIIQRFRAKGTFVRKRRPQDLWCEVRTDWSGMLLARARSFLRNRGSSTNRSSVSSRPTEPRELIAYVGSSSGQLTRSPS